MAGEMRGMHETVGFTKLGSKWKDHILYELCMKPIRIIQQNAKEMARPCKQNE